MPLGCDADTNTQIRAPLSIPFKIALKKVVLWSVVIQLVQITSKGSEVPHMMYKLSCSCA